MAIASLFANDITRRIEEVIKVDQTDAEVIAAELDEYVVTGAIKRHFVSAKNGKVDSKGECGQGAGGGGEGCRITWARVRSEAASSVRPSWSRRVA